MDILVARTEADIETAYARLSQAVCLGCDTETSGFNSRVGKLFSLQLSDGEFNVLVPISEGVGIGRLSVLLANENIVKVFHNAKFDLEFLSAAGIDVRNLFDTMIAEKVLTRGANQSASLAETLYRYFAIDLDKSQRAKFHRRWNGVWSDELVAYALADVVDLPRLRAAQAAWMKRLGLETEFEDQMRKVISPAVGASEKR
jgi:DNA polymerase-1